MCRYFRKKRALVLSLAIIVIPLIAMGLLRDMTIQELVTEADYIVTGRVEVVESQWNDTRDYIYTYVTLSVDEFWKNPLSQSELIVQIPGGIVEDVMQRVSDTPELQIGETVVLFLYDQENAKWIYGWENGKFTIRNNQILELGISVGEFKDQILTIQQQGVHDE